MTTLPVTVASTDVELDDMRASFYDVLRAHRLLRAAERTSVDAFMVVREYADPSLSVGDRMAWFEVLSKAVAGVRMVRASADPRVRHLYPDLHPAATLDDHVDRACLAVCALLGATS